MGHRPIDLSDLEARLLYWRGHGDMREGVRDVASADGLVFLCPGCYSAAEGPEGVHSIRVWFAGRRAPPEAKPDPRWKVSGTRLHELTLEPSINAECWHGWIREGRAVTA